VTLSIYDYYYVTLPIHSHVEVIMVTWYILATVSQLWCFRAGSPNYGPPAKSGPRRHFVNNEKI